MGDGFKARRAAPLGLGLGPVAELLCQACGRVSHCKAPRFRPGHHANVPVRRPASDRPLQAPRPNPLRNLERAWGLAASGRARSGGGYRSRSVDGLLRALMRPPGGRLGAGGGECGPPQTGGLT